MRRLLNLLIFLLSVSFSLLTTNQTVFADSSVSVLPAITVINMIRGNALGRERVDLLPRLQAQWQDTKEHNIQATWLWQYDALTNQRLTDFAKTNLKNQEFGLFLEVDRNLTQKAGVLYRGRGPWYFSDGLFTFSYDPLERKRLIDTIFAQFKTTFGYYPTTVGAWWVDANALSYMQQKYGITASLRAADQYNLDVYSIWGTLWSIPYLASIDNAGIPAANLTTSSKVVIMQWAPRDPLRGYGSLPANGTYSLEDYELKKYDNSYFNYLTDIYLKKPLDQVVIGLENDRDETTFTQGGHYNNLLEAATALRESGKVSISLAKDYAQAFLASKKLLPPTNYFLTTDYKEEDQAFWYNSPNYRIGIQKIGETISVVDYRDYTNKAKEDFSLLPNSSGTLRIYTPAIIDSSAFPLQKRMLATSKEPLQIKLEKENVLLLSDGIIIGTFNQSSFKLTNFSLAFSQPHPMRSYSLFLMIAGIMFIYLLLVSLRRRPNERFTLENLALFMPLLIAYPFFNSWPLNDATYFLDKKELIFSIFFPLIPLPPELKLVFLLQILPFGILMAAHAIFIVRRKVTEFARPIYYALTGLVTILYLHVPYFPLDRSTYKEVALGLEILSVLLIALAILIYIRTKAKKLIILSLAGIPILLFIIGGVLFLSRSRLIITPFEMDGLKVISDRHKDVIYLYPTDKPIYKAIKPVMLDNYHVGERLTGTDWQALVRVKDRLVLGDYKNKLVMVPRYLGSDISPEEIKQFGLTKIFDNSQIAIFE